MKCHYCDKDSVDIFLFFFKGADHWCAVCGDWKKLCEDHRKPTLNFDLRHSNYDSKYDLCPECYNWRYDVASHIIAVRSGHVGNHRTIQIFGHIETRHRHKEQDDAIWEIKYNAALQNANAVLNLKVIDHKASAGNYIYKVWTTSGDLAQVERR